MRSSQDGTSTPLQKMLRVLEDLLQLREQKTQASTGAKISKKLTELQSIYHALDDHTRHEIYQLLQVNNKKLLNALEKKGSKIIKPLELAGHIKDSLPDELKKIIQENPTLSAMKTTAIPTHEGLEEEFFMPDTVRVNKDGADDNQLKDALASADRQLDPNVYAFFRSPDEDSEQASDPLTAFIDALDVLKKTKLHKEKILQGEPKPIGYDNAYRETLLKQINILNNNKHVLNGMKLDAPHHSTLTEIKDKLATTASTNIPARLTLAGTISALVDNGLIDSLRKLAAKNQPDTPRYQ